MSQYRHDPTRDATVTKDVLCTGWREPRRLFEEEPLDTVDMMTEKEYAQAREEIKAAMAFQATDDLHSISDDEDENFLAVIFEQCGPTAGEYSKEYRQAYYRRAQKVQR
jgi:hypothetical protein